MLPPPHEVHHVAMTNDSGDNNNETMNPADPAVINDVNDDDDAVVIHDAGNASQVQLIVGQQQGVSHGGSLEGEEGVIDNLDLVQNTISEERIQDEVSSYTSETSATTNSSRGSVAHHDGLDAHSNLDDNESGIGRNGENILGGGGRPRSASLNIIGNNNDNHNNNSNATTTPTFARSSSRLSTHSTRSTPRSSSSRGTTPRGTPRSTPLRSRPRSNPRTRTPMRQESPLLVLRGSGVVVGGGALDRIGSPSALHGGGIVVGNVGDEVDDLEPMSAGLDVAGGVMVREEEAVVMRGIGPDYSENRTTPIRNRSNPRSSSNHRPGSTRRARSHSIPIQEAPEEEEERGHVNIAGGADGNVEVAPSNDTGNDGAEERVDTNATNGNTGNNGNAVSANNAERPGRAGHWLSRAATSTHATNRRNNSNANSSSRRSSNPTKSRTGLSTKQIPSHRKIRRWNNDRFVNITGGSGNNPGTGNAQLEEMYASLEAMGDDGNQYWKEYLMPNYPCRYRSEFAKLVTDDSKKGKILRERFLKGESGGGKMQRKEEEEMIAMMMMKKNMKKHGGREDGKLEEETEEEKAIRSWMEGKILSKLRKLGVSDALEVIQNNNDDGVLGKQLFRSLSPRVQTVISRSCPSANNINIGSSAIGASVGTPTSSFAGQIIDAFERYLVSMTHGISHAEYIRPEQGVYDVLDNVLISPPHVVLKNRCLLRHEQGAFVPTVHFYFPLNDEQQDQNQKQKDGKSKSSAFHRILLYAVCHFHGLEASSTVLPCNPTSAKNGGKGKNRPGQTKGKSSHVVDADGAVKVVTVQGGVLLAPSLKLLDYVE